MTNPGERRERQLFTGATLAVILVVAAAYSGSLSAGFVYDDQILILKNQLLRQSFDPIAIFTSSFTEHTSVPSKAYYRPLVIASFGLEVASGGFNPRVFHTTNLLLHLLNTALVALLVRRLAGGAVLGAAASLLFGLHPINSEAVLWISGRCDLLAVFFLLVALLLFTGKRSLAKLVLSAVAFSLALLSKEGAIAAIPLFVACELLLGPVDLRSPGRLIPHLVVSGCYFAIRFLVLGQLISPLQNAFLANPLVLESWPTRALTALTLFGRYVAKLIVPFRLSANYYFDSIPVVHSPLILTVLGSAALLAGIVVLAWISRRRLPLASCGLILFLSGIGLVLLATLTGQGAIFAERYLYLPSVGFIVAAVALFRAGLGRLPVPARRPLGSVVVLLIVLIFGARVLVRVPAWRNDEILNTAVLEVYPNNAQAHNNLANAYAGRREFGKARTHLLRALEIYPQYATAMLGLGIITLDSGSPAAAIPYLAQAAAADHPSMAYLTLGDAYVALARYEEAREALLEGQRRYPKLARFLTNLGKVSLNLGRTEEAVRYLKEATTLNPAESEALFQLGYHFERALRPDLARHYFVRLLALDPRGMDIYRKYAQSALVRLGQPR